MTKRFRSLAALMVGLSVLMSGCNAPTTGQEPVETATSDQKEVQKISLGVTLQKMRAQILEMKHLDQVYKGVEYQIYFQIPDEFTQEETLKRIQIEIAFSGKTQELMNVERLKKPLQLFKDDQGSNTYIVRVPSIYKTEYTEDELNYLIDHTLEVHMYLYLDGEKIRDLV